ncbi:hypothetical protein HYO65_gp098 [Tenacibaculum phage PTm1]|uniref:Uncharacterized protein n=2 Tax=Shirahamavirus PTm1 TaxID=2846435 RepID=A0A5S9HX77_9CAUD|nr:hypothetical protein HYO65_gp098 [Tenacibaculum phage PTm1]BBI90490.1 hypothetical protein [Tenacibaculum phage PTm1]BBI90798.1 hypothetical protein [Tenacibaculum phage PTm5]
MDILSKLNSIKVENSSRIPVDLYDKLTTFSDVMLNGIDNVQKHLDYLNVYDQCSEKYFDKTISDLEYKIKSFKINFITDCINSIEARYFIMVKRLHHRYSSYSTDLLKQFKNETPTIESILDIVFEYTEGVSLEEFEKKRAKEKFFNELDDRWQKPLATFTKSGVVTLPEYIYIHNDGYIHSNGRFRSCDVYDIKLLYRVLNLFENDSIELWDDKQNINEFEYDNYVNPLAGKTVIENDTLLSEFNISKKGTIKLRFKEKENANKFFHFFNLHKTTNR